MWHFCCCRCVVTTCAAVASLQFVFMLKPTGQIEIVSSTVYTFQQNSDKNNKTTKKKRTQFCSGKETKPDKIATTTMEKKNSTFIHENAIKYCEIRCVLCTTIKTIH